MSYQVAVIGAGPSGSIAAYILAEKGYKTVLLERKKFPRKKTCAGGLTYKVEGLLKSIGIGMSELPIERVFEKVKVMGYGKEIEVEMDPWVISTTSRSLFDKSLVDIAVSSGVNFLDGSPVTEVRRKDGIFELLAGSKLEAERLVIAEGAVPLVSRKLGIRNFWPKGEVIFALEAERKGDFKDIEFRMDAVEMGYGWVFPRNGKASVGVGGMSNPAEIRRRFQEMFGSDGISAGMIPIVGNRRLEAEGVYLVGDIAGLADPMTGEGIYYGMKSAVEAARALTEGKSYEDLMKPIIEDLSLRRRVASIVLPKMRRFFLLMVDKEEIAERFTWASAGKISFRDFIKWVVFRFPSLVPSLLRALL
ncbi:MAG: NAD(P)/FAD-dependent oxidoreductase [Candidatus Methanodesulfokora washburnensis]|jgi:geranylgeranyl reductase family protein